MGDLDEYLEEIGRQAAHRGSAWAARLDDQTREAAIAALGG